MKGCNVARYLGYEKSFPGKTFGKMLGSCLLSYLCNTKTTKKYIAMKKFILTVIIFVLGFVSASAQNFWGSSDNSSSSSRTQQSTSATITFKNKSDYTMTLKVMYLRGGLYQTVTLSPHSSRVVSFSRSNSFKLKIKAVHNGSPSYHNGGNFSVTCTSTEWTEGEMSFSLSTYGSGLGPSISAKEFESNN